MKEENKKLNLKLNFVFIVLILINLAVFNTLFNS